MKISKLVSVIIFAAIILLITAVYLRSKPVSGRISLSGAGKKLHNKSNRSNSMNEYEPKDTAHVNTADISKKIEKLCHIYNLPFYIDNATEETRLEIPESMRLVTGLAADKSYRSRMDAIRRLRGKLSGRNLSSAEIEALLSFLHEDPKREKLSLLETDAIKNDVMSLLMDQKRNDIHLSEHLVAMFHDKKLDSVWREYCVQFMGQWYRNADEDKQKLMQYSMKEAINEGSGEIQGTALLWASRLTDTGDFDREEIRNKAYELSVDDTVPAKIRMTSLQVASNMHHPEIAKLARKIIEEKNGDVLLKMSAIAVLGKNGNSGDLVNLARLAKSSDVRLRTPARAAIKKLEEGR